MGASVRLTVDEGVATIRLDRPPMNALDTAMQDELRAAAGEVSEREDIAAVVLYGGEKVFAAGADVKEMATMSFADMELRSRQLSTAFDAVARIPKPVVAAVTGYALGGGCELALTADRRIAASTAVLGQPEIKLGIIPGAGGTQRLARLIGPAKAKDLIFTGRMVDAREALAMGLVDEVVDVDPHEPGEAVYQAARRWAAQFVDGPRCALRAAKNAIDRGLDVDLATGLEIERQAFAALFATQDREIGMKAFVTKSQPRFTGR
ncbi:enoyl-CoA hydratase/isomerase family protein [Thermasporomyces composti]|uniref:enoyl-CoA hydratase n=1 Tax=Thermasporomyces composti TaxID=696763 RepID=A0A3D9V3L0_THECX|nr:enoyl-CoA hydratase-related protein [Thermasporomyces composti]REF35283.1 short chain enoyl-CoA hydratase [Thermasporomyces composti]